MQAAGLPSKHPAVEMSGGRAPRMQSTVSKRKEPYEDAGARQRRKTAPEIETCESALPESAPSLPSHPVSETELSLLRLKMP